MASSGITFVPGDLVVSLVGNTDGSAPGDNQASPIELAQFTLTGTTSATLAGTTLLPQTTVTTNGVTQYAISGEYGSSSEGSLQLAANRQSLVIAGYGVNAAAYNKAEATGGPNTYGNAALAQTYSVPNGGTNGAPAGVTPVARVVADIRYDGTVDTSTALFNVFNTNNPRSVATVDGTSFYLGGQGVKGDTTQGVFYAADGASSATAINTADDVRTVEIQNGSLYVSQDSKQPSNGGTSNISSFASAQPTAASAETPLPGISQTVTLSTANGGNGNGINNSTGTIHLSPENYVFANATTLYVADGGNPKQGGLGDGGLQKYSLVNGNWTLDYTLSAGLNLVADTATAGTTGLIGLTGQVNAATGTVSLYATNSTIGDTDQTYLYGITDSLAATTATQAAGESFSTLYTAPAGTNVRGVAFAPVCFASGTPIRTNKGEVAVEDLKVGDFVVTSTGERRPIRWLGQRTIDCGSHPERKAVLPVRIAAHAFAQDRPSRDVLVSPGHALCVDVLGEVLIPALSLVNGSTVAQVEVDSVTYWHVELDSHDILVAAGMPAESYLEMGNRGFFAGQPVVTLDGVPDRDLSEMTVASHADFCRPFYADGAIVIGVRAQMAVRARALGWTLEPGDALAGLQLVADGRRIDPVRRGLAARFAVPAGAGDLRLVCDTIRPCDLGMSTDMRLLGVDVASIAVSDGFGAPRAIAIDDPRLDRGFHAAEMPADAPMHRWTDGDALLPAEVVGDHPDGAFLVVTLVQPALPRWAARPAAAPGESVNGG